METLNTHKEDTAHVSAGIWSILLIVVFIIGGATGYYLGLTNDKSGALRAPVMTSEIIGMPPEVINTPELGEALDAANPFEEEEMMNPLEDGYENPFEEEEVVNPFRQ